MTVWLLLMVILSATPGIQSNTLLNKFDTAEECEQERNRIGKDMAESYPGDMSYRIDCKKTEITSPQINYTESIKKWADKLHPGFSYTFRVTAVKRLGVTADGEHTPKGSMALQVVLEYANGNSESYIILIGEGGAGVYAWIKVVAPEESEPEEVFPQKDAT